MVHAESVLCRDWWTPTVWCSVHRALLHSLFGVAQSGPRVAPLAAQMPPLLRGVMPCVALTAFGHGQFYYVFGFLALVVVILMITCSEISIVLVYFQLCSEDYNWWWRSMVTSGSSGLYLFLYGIFYYATKVRSAFGSASCILDRGSSSHRIVPLPLLKRCAACCVGATIFVFDPPPARYHGFHLGLDVLRVHVPCLVCVCCGHGHDRFRF